MDDSWLVENGLNAIARAHELDYFADGHRGAAMIAAYYLLRELPLSSNTAVLITARVREQWIASGRYRAFPLEKAEPGLLERIVETLGDNLTGMRQAGHNVILPALAIKAFHEFPHLITKSRVAGICAMIPLFTVQHDRFLHPVEDAAGFADRCGAAEWILREFIACGDRFDGRGRGWTGHLLTYGRALLDLQELGYEELVHNAGTGFRLYLDRIRSGPQETDIERAEHAHTGLLPEMDAYWQSPRGDWGLGHVLKYPYGLYGLLRQARNQDLVDQCLAAAYRIV